MSGVHAQPTAQTVVIIGGLCTALKLISGRHAVDVLNPEPLLMVRMMSCKFLSGFTPKWASISF